MYWHLQHLGWNHSGICESPVYYENTVVFYSLWQRRNTVRKLVSPGSFSPDLFSLSHLRICPLPKGTIMIMRSRLYSAQKSWVSAIRWRHYAFPEGQVLQMMVKRDLVNDTKSSMVTNNSFLPQSALKTKPP